MRRAAILVATAALLADPASAETARTLSIQKNVGLRLGAETASCSCPAQPGHDQAGKLAPAIIAGALLGGVAGAAIAHAPATHLGLTALRNAALGGVLAGGAGFGLAASSTGNAAPKAACATHPDAGNHATWYDVIYEYRGKTYREQLGYNPGALIEVDSLGQAPRLPYDNPR